MVIRLNKYVILSVFSLVLLAPFVHAEDNSKWCGTVTAIYGICSPQLIDNWLAHKSDVYVSPKRPPKPLETTIASQITPNPLGLVNPTGEKPKPIPCWYMTPEGMKFCRFVG